MLIAERIADTRTMVRLRGVEDVAVVFRAQYSIKLLGIDFVGCGGLVCFLNQLACFVDKV